MCLINVKDEEDYAVPVRVKTVRRISRQPSPSRSVRRSVVVERRSENVALGPLPPSIPPPARSYLPAPAETVTSVRSERRTSRAPSRAPSRARSQIRSAYIEVDEETSSSSESSVSRRTRKTSKSRRNAPASEYSLHEKEVRRERGYSRPRDEYETYRYVESPRNQGRGAPSRDSHYENPRSSRDDYGKRVTIEDDYRRSSRQYRS